MGVPRRGLRNMAAPAPSCADMQLSKAHDYFSHRAGHSRGCPVAGSILIL